MAKLVLAFEGTGLRTLVKRLEKEKVPVARYCAQSPERLKEMLDHGINIYGRPTAAAIQMCQEYDIPYALVYPALNTRTEYVGRWVMSARKLAYVHELRREWVPEITRISGVQCESVLCLGEGKYLPHPDDPVWTYRAKPKGNA